ncbi:AMP-binding protein [Methanobacterium sp.]|uniref:AMP-binding protein n=1 Tax=Methanobacterium sp. TaxID=2164 RepID=UPI0026000394|nr:AMP-binding protein [Methanobacterium sp.]
MNNNLNENGEEKMPSTVLITGANGFLGTQITRQLIKRDDLKIIALVRAESKEQALKRLERAWYDWEELTASLNHQVKVVPGDITLENLGLDEDDYQELASSINHIIHTVADLGLHTPLEELRKTNLEGTCKLLELAHHAKDEFKGFSHISTAYIAGKQKGIILEDELTDQYGFWSNYEKSKYEAEIAVRKSGLPFTIFRPGMVVGDSKTGEIKTFNTVYALLKLYLTGRIRLIPTSPSLTLNMVPVDYVACAVADLTFSPKVEGKTFHLTTPTSQLPTIRELLDLVQKWARKELGVNLPSPIFLPISSLIQKVSSPHRLKHSSGLLNTLFTLAPYLDEKRVFSQENIQKYLDTNIPHWENYLPVILNYAVYRGFFHRSERTVHEQVLFRLKSKSYPVSCYDIVDGHIKEKHPASLREDIQNAAGALKEMGIHQGDRVALVGLNSSRYLTLEVAIGLLGAVSVPLYYTSPPMEINNVLKASGAKILFIGTPHLMKRLDELHEPPDETPNKKPDGIPDKPHNKDQDENLNESKNSYKPLEMVSFCRESQKIPDNVLSWSRFLEKWNPNHERGLSLNQAPVSFSDLATIRYTSGTTGKPKGVTFNHGNLRWMAESMASLPSWKDRNREVRYLSFLPMNHVVEGILGTYSPYYAPAPLKIHFLEDFNHLASALPQVRPTIFFSVPRFYEKLWSNLKNTSLGGHYIHLKEGTLKKILKPLVRRSFLNKAGLDRCAQLIVGSATSSQQLTYDYHELEIEVHNAYGLTEAPLVTLNRRGVNRIGTVGEALPETSIKIAEDNEIMIKGPQVTPGYFETDLDPPIKDGWLKTGDMGYLTPEGSLVITGRKKELMINSYGKSIDPLRIEALLRDAPGTCEVMLVGEGKPYLGGLFWVEENYNPHDISKTIQEINQGLSRPEQVKRWVILSNDLSIDGGDLTANMKLKREIITRRYQDVIDALYQGTSHPLILHIDQLEADNGT